MDLHGAFHVYDTTLRDGAQQEGLNLSVADKLTIARQLDGLGVRDLHFSGDDVSPAVKLGGCMISHVINEIDVQCLPKDLPEFVTVDLSALEAGASVHLSQVKLPAGVELVQHGEGDPVVATALVVKGAAAEGETEGEQA